MTNLSRRDFLRCGAAGLVAGAGLSIWLARSARGDEARPLAGAGPGAGADQPWDYAFVLLGDIHYDRWSYHDMDWVKREKPHDIHQIQGYVKVTEDFTPPLLARVAATVRSSAVPMPFVIQIGDLVEGLCGSYDLAVQQSQDAIAAVEAARIGKPFLITKGNHDITGPGAPEAFDKVLLPWLGRQAGQSLSSASYTVRQGDDLFVFFDAYKPELDWLEHALRAPARHVFFLIHPPVVPYNERSNWSIFAAESEVARRTHLLKLLARHQAIVLSGHLHKYGMVERRVGGDCFAQLAVCSVIRHAPTRPVHELHGLKDYGPNLVDLNPHFSPGTLEERRHLLEVEKPYITHFDYADLPGYAVIRVGPQGVAADTYPGFNQPLWAQEPLAPAGAVARG